MGVIYKLTDDVVDFIVKRKNDDLQLSCREIADLVYDQHQRLVSKSSVHDVLKSHGISIPRGRKPKKTKFQIPLEKKKQLFASIPASILLPELPPPLTPPTRGGESGEILVKAVFYDLFPRPLWGMKGFDDIKSLKIDDLEKEWAYITTPVAHFKIDLEDGTSFDIDSRFQALGAAASIPAGIERATQEAVDFFLNGVKPLCIRSVSASAPETLVSDFIQACEGLPGKGMAQVSLITSDGTVAAQFACFPRQKKNFILGIPENIKVEQDTIKNGISIHKVDGNKGNEAIIYNIIPKNNDSEIVKIFQNRHPGRSLPDFLSSSGISKASTENITDQPAWLLAQLKARATLFFPPGANPDATGIVLALDIHDENGQRISPAMGRKD